MTDDERDAYSRGVCNAYNDVFKAFTIAFADGRDIHWLRGYIAEQFDVARATVRVVL